MVLVIVFLSGCNTRYVKTTAAVLSAAGVQEADIINSCTDRRNVDQCMASTINYAAERGREENARAISQTQYAHVIRTADGKLSPEQGWTWVTQSEGDFRVKPVNTIVNANGNGYRPAPGYRWVTEQPGDFRVVRRE